MEKTYLTKDSFLKAIDDLELYEKDYNVIELLLKEKPSLFVKILEEVLLGNLYFADFYEVLEGDTTYEKILERNFISQEKLIRQIKTFKYFHENADYNAIAISNQLSNPVNKNYKKYEENDRESLFYEIFRNSANDSIITQAAKLKLFNAIENYRALNSKDPDSLHDSLDFEETLSINGQLPEIKEKRYDIINPADILFYKDDVEIPVSYSDQILNLADEEFMLQNNMTQNDMKKLKAFTIFLDNLRIGGEDGTN